MNKTRITNCKDYSVQSSVASEDAGRRAPPVPDRRRKHCGRSSNGIEYYDKLERAQLERARAGSGGG